LEQQRIVSAVDLCVKPIETQLQGVEKQVAGMDAQMGGEVGLLKKENAKAVEAVRTKVSAALMMQPAVDALRQTTMQALSGLRGRVAVL
jgi:hypothetical protein